MLQRTRIIPSSSVRLWSIWEGSLVNELLDKLRALDRTSAADIGLCVSSNISTLANYDIDAITIQTFRFIMVICKSKHSMTSWTCSWQSFHDLFCLNSNNHNILYVGILTNAAIARNYSSSILQTRPMNVISWMPLRISRILLGVQVRYKSDGV